MVYNNPDKLEKHYISIDQKDHILQFLLKKYKLDLTEYSEASVRRRITKIINDYNLTSTQELGQLLLSKPNGKNEFLEKFTVNVTELFRDPTFYSSLRENALYKLRDQEEIMIWSAGCSSGEEVISLAILLHEEGLLHKTKIMGTDLSNVVLNKARKGQYPLRNLKAFKQAYIQMGGKSKIDEYYVTVGDTIIFENFLLENISYHQLNLLETIFEERFDLVICRNVLIYFKASLQNKVIGHFKKALKPNRYLGLGSKESILFYQDRDQFQEIDSENKIYQKIR